MNKHPSHSSTNSSISLDKKETLNKEPEQEDTNTTPSTHSDNPINTINPINTNTNVMLTFQEAVGAPLLPQNKKYKPSPSSSMIKRDSHSVTTTTPIKQEDGYDYQHHSHYNRYHRKSQSMDFALSSYMLKEEDDGVNKNDHDDHLNDHESDYNYNQYSPRSYPGMSMSTSAMPMSSLQMQTLNQLPFTRLSTPMQMQMGMYYNPFAGALNQMPIASVSMSPMNIDLHHQHHQQAKPNFFHSTSVDSETADFLSTIDFNQPTSSVETPFRKRNRGKGKKGRNDKQRRVKWNDLDIYTLWKTIAEKGNEWREIHNCLPNRTYHQVKDKGRRMLQQEQWSTGRTKNDSEMAGEVAKEIALLVVQKMRKADPQLEVDYERRENAALHKGGISHNSVLSTLGTIEEHEPILDADFGLL